MPSLLELTVNRHRAALLRGEREAAVAMVRAYGAGWTRIDRELRSVWGLLTEDTNPATWRVRQAERLESLRAQVDAELRRLAPIAERTIEGQQSAAVTMAHAHALEAAGAAGAPVEVLGQFDRLPRGAVETLVGFAGDGSPLRALADEIGRGVGQNVIDALAAGIIAGANPRVTARLMREAFGVGASRALTIARTETMRVYRAASLETYRANRSVVTGWIWIASMSPRTCISCWAMHGSEHGLNEVLGDHPNGRCVPAPILRNTPVVVEPGLSVFARQPVEVQRRVLGPAAYLAWQDGALDLAEMVGRRFDPRWGTMRSARSLQAVIGRDAARVYRDMAWATPEVSR
jgi:SPP1 gp7 family putative phage head morphogenesis protein